MQSEWSFKERTMYQKRMIEVSPISPFNVEFELGKFDSLSFHLSQILRKRSKENKYSKRGEIPA